MNIRELLKELKFNGVEKIYVRRHSDIHEGVKEIMEAQYDNSTYVLPTEDERYLIVFRCVGLTVCVNH